MAWSSNPVDPQRASRTAWWANPTAPTRPAAPGWFNPNPALHTGMGSSGTLSAIMRQIERITIGLGGDGSLHPSASNVIQRVSAQFDNSDSSHTGTATSGLSAWSYIYVTHPVDFTGSGALAIEMMDGLRGQLVKQYQASDGQGSVGTLAVLMSQIYTLAANFTGGSLLSFATEGGTDGLHATAYPGASGAESGVGTLSASARMFSLNAGVALGGAGSLTANVFKAYSETSTVRTGQAVPAGCTGCWVTLRGGGGGGGNTTGASLTNIRGGGGGGGGGVIIRSWIPVASLGSTYSVTVGTGGAAANDGVASTFTSGSGSLTASGGTKGGNGSSATTGTGGGGGTTSVSVFTGISVASGTAGGGGGNGVAGTAGTVNNSGAGAGGGGGGGRNGIGTIYKGGDGGNSSNATGGQGGQADGNSGAAGGNTTGLAGAGAGGGAGGNQGTSTYSNGGQGGTQGGGGGGAGGNNVNISGGAGGAGWTLIEWF